MFMLGISIALFIYGDDKKPTTWSGFIHRCKEGVGEAYNTKDIYKN
jgi:hypothetical protein